MSNLPINWSEAPIGSFARVVGGGTPPSKDPANFAMPGQGIPWLTPADLSGYRHQTIQRGARDLTEAGFAACGATLLPKGSVLFSSRAPIGYVAIAANQISTNQGFKSFVLPEGFDPRFTYYQLKHLKPEAEAIATGTTFKELSGAAAATLPFRVAPLAEQARIADQLDTLLARVNACNDHLDAIPGILKRFRHAVLGAAASGLLTEDWRTQNNVPSWRPTTIGALTSSSYYGPRFSKEEYTEGLAGIPTVRTTDMDRVGRVHVTEETPRVLVPLEKLEQYRVKAGDLLVTRTGSIGVMAVFEGDYLAIPSAYLIRFRFNADLRTRFAYYHLASPKGQDELGLSATAVTQPNVNAEAIKKIPIDLPSLAEQDEIILRVEGLFGVADRIEARYTTMRTQAQRLTPRVLAKAFRGELVPQDPSDEPASNLLARIAAQRAAPTTEPKTRKPRQARGTPAPKEAAAMTKSRQDDDVKGKPYLASHLRRLGAPTTAEALFKESELPVADFYKQLAWEVAQGHVKDNQTSLEPGHAAG